MIVHPVILSGGAGTRLWPISRSARPKQLHRLTGEGTMLQMTAARVADPAMFGPATVIASEPHAAEIAAQLAGNRLAALILEPCGRNTAAAVALAALEAAPDDLLLVMPSDHVISRPDHFHAAVAAAAPLAAEDWLVTFGIAPQHPETGYGYIRRGAQLTARAFEVAAFVEKPDRATAERYLAGGDYDWNGGIFLFRAGAMLAALEQHAPDILAATREALLNGARETLHVRPDADSFARVRSQSIDHAVMEAHDRIAVVPVDMAWSDVGSWDALHELGAQDAAGNVASGAVLAPGSRDCLLYSDGPKLVAVGVSDLIVVATGDAVLIMPRGESQRVREAVDALKAERHPSLDR